MSFINKLFGNKKEKVDINESVKRDIEIFEETKKMDWQNTCLVINSKSSNIEERELLKDRILYLRKIKGVI